MKPTFEQAKLELEKVEGAIKSLQTAGVEIPPVLNEQYEKLKKVLEGNVSAQVAEKLNATILKALNENEKHAELKAGLAKLIGTKARLNIVVELTGEGEVKIPVIKFEAGGSVSTGTSSGGGGTRSESAFNHYKVELTEDVPNLGSKGLVKEFDSAASVVKFILNDGKNPMNLGAGFGKGNAMTRVLESLGKNEVFKKTFKVEGSKVEKAKAETPATDATVTDATPQTGAVSATAEQPKA